MTVGAVSGVAVPDMSVAMEVPPMVTVSHCRDFRGASLADVGLHGGRGLRAEKAQPFQVLMMLRRQFWGRHGAKIRRAKPSWRRSAMRAGEAS
jgi:hypothetical protein